MESEILMRRALITLLIVTSVVMLPIEVGRGQIKKAQCQTIAPGEQNWALMGQDYVYFDAVLCPADMDPANPLVRIWITSNGDGIAVEKWSQSRNGADLVSVFHGKKKVYTVYRDLNAVPLSVFKAERRSGVATEVAKLPFFVEGTTLAPFENLTPDSAERASKTFENADILIKTAEAKGAPINETVRILTIIDALDKPLKLQP